jgi:hypothetical protein
MRVLAGANHRRRTLEGGAGGKAASGGKRNYSHHGRFSQRSRALTSSIKNRKSKIKNS